MGGASLQALRQFGGTFGVALAIAFVGRPADLAEALAGFDRVWWLIVVGGLATSVLVAPMRTGSTARIPATGSGAAAT